MPHPSPTAATGAARHRILVIDDDPDQLEIAQRILEGAGYLVESAFDGREALARLEHGPVPDLIVVDLVMPVMTGWQFVSELRGRPPVSQTPVVVVSGGGDHLLSSAPVSSGYLTKPLDADRFLETIAVSLVRKGKRRPSGSQPIGG
jgi:CheY-like chemotaxis protein